MQTRVKVVLCGKEYILATEDSPSYVYQVAKTLEKRISDITEKDPRISPHSAVIMAAFSTMDELTKANNAVEVIRTQLKEYVDEAGQARLARDAALREIDTLKAKVEQLENLLKLHDLKQSAQEGKAPRQPEDESDDAGKQLPLDTEE
ncbi:MAG: cell division protein ZapA [Oscillospiraceae bacterium]|nr:cell division protein ZapA [Oscillospiraceae bacterium]